MLKILIKLQETNKIQIYQIKDQNYLAINFKDKKSHQICYQHYMASKKNKEALWIKTFIKKDIILWIETLLNKTALINIKTSLFIKTMNKILKLLKCKMRTGKLFFISFLHLFY